MEGGRQGGRNIGGPQFTFQGQDERNSWEGSKIRAALVAVSVLCAAYTQIVDDGVPRGVGHCPLRESVVVHTAARRDNTERIFVSEIRDRFRSRFPAIKTMHAHSDPRIPFLTCTFSPPRLPLRSPFLGRAGPQPGTEQKSRRTDMHRFRASFQRRSENSLRGGCHLVFQTRSSWGWPTCRAALEYSLGLGPNRRQRSKFEFWWAAGESLEE